MVTRLNSPNLSKPFEVSNDFSPIGFLRTNRFILILSSFRRRHQANSQQSSNPSASVKLSWQNQPELATNSNRSQIWILQRSPSGSWRSPMFWAELVCFATIRVMPRAAGKWNATLYRFPWRCHASQSGVHGRYHSKHHSQRQRPRYEHILSIVVGAWCGHKERIGSAELLTITFS